MVSLNTNLRPFSNLALAEYREKTFVDWPFKKGKCTAKEMARAGFYVAQKNGDTTVTCYFCFKELEGWEENDDPFQEHKKHASYCSYVNMFVKAPDTISFSQCMQLERDRAKRLLELQTDMINTSSKEILEKIIKSNNTSKRGRKRK